MNGKFIVYALVVAFGCVAASWGELLTSSRGGGGGSGARSGNSWSSSSSSSSGSAGSWSGGGHK